MSLLKVNAIQNIAGEQRFGPVLMTPQTASGTSVVFTGIPDWAKKVTVMFNGVSTSGTSIVQVQLGDVGGFQNTGYASTNFIVANTTAGSGSVTTGFNIINTGAALASNLFNGHMVITNVTNNIWVESFYMSVSTTTATAGGGGKTLTGALDRVRITTVNGTDVFDAGILNVMYE